MTDAVAFWTAADQAELDVLVHALVAGYFEHRGKCRACRPDACADVHDAATCPRCNPCPHVGAAITAVVEWREARVLRSRAEALREIREAV
jgi:hypothetical protein